MLREDLLTPDLATKRPWYPTVTPATLTLGCCALASHAILGQCAQPSKGDAGEAGRYSGFPLCRRGSRPLPQGREHQSDFSVDAHDGPGFPVSSVSPFHAARQPLESTSSPA